MVSSWLHESGARSPLFWALIGVLAAGCGDDGSESTDSGSTSVAASSGAESTSSATNPGTSTTDPGSTGLPGTGTSTGAADSSTGEPGTDSGSDSTGGTADCHPIIKEVFYDVDGPSDDMFQWVAFYNPCPDAIDMTTYTIMYGGENWATWDKEIMPLPADTMIEAGGCYYVGGPNTAAKNGGPEFNYSSDFSPGLFRDDMFGGGVALFEMPPDQITKATVPLDAVIYGPNNDHMLLDSAGAVPGDAFAPHPAPGGSVQRMGMGDVWATTVAPQPASCPGF